MSKSLLALAAALLAACGSDSRTTAPAADPASPVERIVLVSVDGLRGDALASMPRLEALLPRALWTDAMRTVVPSLTLPGHLAMFDGRDVTRLGAVDNVLDERLAARLIMAGATSLFEWVHAAGGTSVALVASSLVPVERIPDAKRFFGADAVISVPHDALTIADKAIGVLSTPPDGLAAPGLVFVHIPTVDDAGHRSGWISPSASAARGSDVLSDEYLRAVRGADEAIARLWSALRADVEAGRTALVVTSDHGGGHGEGCVPGVPPEREHCSAHSADVTIPFVLIARPTAPGRVGGSPRLTQVAPLLAHLLSIAPKPAPGTDEPLGY